VTAIEKEFVTNPAIYGTEAKRFDRIIMDRATARVRHRGPAI